MTSLPGPYGSGDVGPQSLRFLDWAAEAGQSVWQVLPLTPCGGGYSPYSGPSAFAGNPLLISPERLRSEGWLGDADLEPPPENEASRIAFERVVPWRIALLRRSWEGFCRSASPAARQRFDAFVEDPDQACWLEDWALFASLKHHHGGQSWTVWDSELRQRRPEALRAAGRELAAEIRYQRYLQFVFFDQWAQLREAARVRGIAVLGDLPFYPALDSADVWSHPELFLLDDAGRPPKVSGVPPDAFSDTGQLWGQPVYRWEHLARTGYRWWVDRLRANLRLVDRLRLDHFRAFAAHWEVDADAATAEDGRWVPGPGRELFQAIERALGPLPLLAEDLGLITEDVHALREALGLPGMRVLQFAVGDGDNEHAPGRYTSDVVAYTGTHDNDTARGWFEALPDAERSEMLELISAREDDDVVWRMIEAIYGSEAGWAITPLQDLFGLGSEARMNHPGRSSGSWRFRAEPSSFTLDLAARLRDLASRTGRLGPREHGPL